MIVFKDNIYLRYPLSINKNFLVVESNNFKGKPSFSLEKQGYEFFCDNFIVISNIQTLLRIVKNMAINCP